MEPVQSTRDQEEFNKLKEKYQDKEYIDLVIINNDWETPVWENEFSVNKFNVIYDRAHKYAAKDFPDQYYCSTLEELHTTLTFIENNYMQLLNTKQQDILDSNYESFDENNESYYL